MFHKILASKHSLGDYLHSKGVFRLPKMYIPRHSLRLHASNESIKKIKNKKIHHKSELISKIKKSKANPNENIRINSNNDDNTSTNADVNSDFKSNSETDFDFETDFGADSESVDVEMADVLKKLMFKNESVIFKHKVFKRFQFLIEKKSNLHV